ncbi:GntR family transcriptional regulator [Mucilaginibacter myungsuensis]|uniref:GntR family transcriptional regulator n=1 Tax=Mucilaginibacter myungsuensis TaxID=649104 RepID=A0A929PWY8_9SPHI|nr:GntR family transcriptional regulator [Mucilaginibacter myungsuensis]MBE9662629.1 GntR family transcriptional regulator [Mucilaginibacter myungsuensis]MDN3598049.1 GntR family transcriptional regulator [Mucilaginibacter myungsuensis]
MANVSSNSTIIFDKIRLLEKLRSLSKHEKLVQGILDAIADGALQVNDALPTVNTMIAELGYARETIIKAYRELIERGVIASQNRKGYFVVSTNTSQKQKIALIMYAFDAFQEALYQSFIEHVGADMQVDLYFHHNNPDVFEAVFNRIAGHYGLYIVAPIINDHTDEILAQLSPSKLLLIDRYVDLGSEHSYIVQEFEDSSYKIFKELEAGFKKYDELIFFFREHTAEPEEILRSFRKFISESGIEGSVETHFRPGSIQKGKAYFSIHNPELYAILKESMDKGLQPGEEIGVLAHNDDIVKEIIAGGITTFSVDFREIGRLAAQFAIDRQKIQITLPTLLHQRKSL